VANSSTHVSSYSMVVSAGRIFGYNSGIADLVQIAGRLINSAK